MWYCAARQAAHGVVHLRVPGLVALEQQPTQHDEGRAKHFAQLLVMVAMRESGRVLRPGRC